MANFDTAKLVKSQVKITRAFNAAELRFREPVVHKMFLRNTALLIPQASETRDREDKPVTEFNYDIKQLRALGSARSHNHTGVQGDSGVLTPTWATYTDKFVSSLKEADNKVMSLEDMHANKMENFIANMANGLEAAASGYLFANRSGVNVSTSFGSFDATDDTFEITETLYGNTAIDVTKSIMDINEYQGVGHTVVCDPIAFSKFKVLAANGATNATNTAFQMGGVTFVNDITLTAAAAGLVSAYAKGYWIVVPDGSVAAPNWIPIQNVRGVNTTVANFGSLINPIDALQYAVHTYETSADASSIGGYLQDVKLESEFSVDVAYVHAPMSTAGETPMMAFAFV